MFLRHEGAINTIRYRRGFVISVTRSTLRCGVLYYQFIVGRVTRIHFESIFFCVRHESFLDDFDELEQRVARGRGDRGHSRGRCGGAGRNGRPCRIVLATFSIRAIHDEFFRGSVPLLRLPGFTVRWGG